MNALTKPENLQPSAKRIISAEACQYHPEVYGDDLLAVDLSVNQVLTDGLYLVERYEADRVTWMGCRRFELSLTGAVYVKETNGDLVPFDGSLVIAGKVETVYRPTKNL
jgi:hypothetical protein